MASIDLDVTVLQDPKSYFDAETKHCCRMDVVSRRRATLAMVECSSSTDCLVRAVSLECRHHHVRVIIVVLRPARQAVRAASTVLRRVDTPVLSMYMI